MGSNDRQAAVAAEGAGSDNVTDCECIAGYTGPDGDESTDRPDSPEWAQVIRTTLRVLGLRSGFEPPDLDRPGRLPHQQGLCEARLGYQDESPQLGAPLVGSPLESEVTGSVQPT